MAVAKKAANTGGGVLRAGGGLTNGFSNVGAFLAGHPRLSFALDAGMSYATGG